MHNAIGLFKKTTYVSIATVIPLVVGFYRRENIWMKVNQE